MVGPALKPIRQWSNRQRVPCLTNLRRINFGNNFIFAPDEDDRWAEEFASIVCRFVPLSCFIDWNRKFENAQFEGDDCFECINEENPEALLELKRRAVGEQVEEEAEWVREYDEEVEFDFLLELASS